MPRPRSSFIDLSGAETLALQALTFLLSETQRLSRFLSLTGIGPADIRAAAATSGLQAATLEYLLSDESLLLMFCQEAGVDPAIIAPAHDILSKHGQ
jgi:hypothetical protein